MPEKDSDYFDNTATIRIDRGLVKGYKGLAVTLDTSVRKLTEEALRAYLPQLERKAQKGRKAS